ncbi:ABC transporter permease (plasmid) [Rhizobium sp. CB3171]|uniref:ABC transporter permease n=1 Tax=Rhizobium sp. CB3171 TaxID=3039157 RepID=UPI0024B0FE9B|nr:ABC transporter permease [Rhizobium sp. CB3171]WFU06923.1 ABC transporter permease [Rhizobium sp. CB3171]
MPGLGAVVGNAMMAMPELVAAIGRTGLEALLGFGLAAGAGVIWGTLFAKVGLLERAVLPLFVALQTIPVVAFGAIVVIWFGNTLLAKVFISFFLAFFPISVNTLQGLKAVNAQRIDLFRSFGASSCKTYRSVELPAALPNIAVGLKTGVSLALVGAIVGEWFGDTTGLGVMLLQALYFEDVLRTWVLIITTGLVGGTFYGLIALFERNFIWWRSE